MKNTKLNYENITSLLEEREKLKQDKNSAVLKQDYEWAADLRTKEKKLDETLSEYDKQNLFIHNNVTLNSGLSSDFKIECDALNFQDTETLAYLISKKFIFKEVHGVPTGGINLANALKKYINKGSAYTLIVDDVLTTGKSMEVTRELLKLSADSTYGVVVFSRGKCPSWVYPIFQMWNN